jgi:hypothetical protein
MQIDSRTAAMAKKSTKSVGTMFLVATHSKATALARVMFMVRVCDAFTEGFHSPVHDGPCGLNCRGSSTDRRRL